MGALAYYCTSTLALFLRCRPQPLAGSSRRLLNYHCHVALRVQRRRPGLNLPLSTVVDRTDGYSGAELEQVVIEAMHLAFAEIRELTESDLILAASQLVPLSRTAREQMDSLKQWASAGRARPASLRAVTNPDAA